jgi:hypothetical protein
MLLLFITTAQPLSLVNCYSWGAGSCISGGAIGGYHLESYEGQSNINMTVPKDEIRCIRTGSLGSSGIEVTIGNQSMSSDTKEIKPLQYNVDYEIEIYRLTSIFRGVLIRLSSPDSNTTDLTGKLYTTDPLLQMATTACATPTVAVGVTHRSAIDKDLVYATLRFDNDQVSSSFLNETSLYNLEITVVGMNNEEGSVYAYSSYQITVSGQASSSKEDSSIDGDSSDDGRIDDKYTPDLNLTTDDELAGDNPLQDGDTDGNAPRDIEQSSSLVIGFTTIGGACVVAIFALVMRAKVQRSRVLNSPLGA